MSSAPNANRPWKEIAIEAQNRRADSIAAVSPPKVPSTLPLNVTSIPAQILSPLEDAITTTPAETLISHLATSKWSATTVINAFLRRAAVAQALTNCVTDLLPDRALARANFLDNYLRQHRKPIGPLHGLPISVKEHVGMKGLDLNAAFSGLYGQIADEDALILQILWNAGAIFYVRTTEPQLLMHLETASNLYGATVNPYNTKLTSGGSSGGEGALVGLRGSCLGIGTDIGGSIRSPAADCGVYGLKMTSLRMPVKGLSDGAAGYEQILGTIGPLSTSLEGITLFSKTIIDAKPWLKEPHLVPLPWDMATSKLPERLRVAVLWDDGVVKPHPPILRALREAVDKLKAAASDVEILDWIPYKHDKAWEILSTLYFPDGGKEEADIIAGTDEPWLPLSDFILRKNPLVRAMSVAEVWDWTDKRDRYRDEHAAHWNATASRFDAQGMPVDAVDVILCPVGPGAAPPLDCSRYWCYTSQWNLVDQPALVFPFGKVDQKLDVKDESYQPRNDQDSYNHNLYTPETYVDAPICLQLVGRRYEEEKLIQAFERIQSYF